jgi:predicted transposase YbfD/YdcC
VGTLPVADRDEEKQTNEINIAIPLLEALDIQDKTITADALLTQRELARYLVEPRGNALPLHRQGQSKKLLEETAYYFDPLDREPDHTTLDSPEHGRIEIRNIRVTTALNDCLNFPHVGQAFKVQRITIHQKNGKQTREVTYGITSKTPNQASAAPRRLQNNRGHWCIEYSCH